MKILGNTLPRRFKAKASGSITAGKPCIVEADGDVAQVTASNLTSENYIGIAEYTVSDTETATVLIKGGISTIQSSLTPGQTYFVQTDSTLGLTADSPSVIAGTAVTSTKLIVKG